MFQKGFTLIELMVVITIIGILASVAIPNYQQYALRAQVTESLTLADTIKIALISYYKVKGEFPKNNKEAGLPPSDKLIGNYVSSMDVSDGAINITLGNKVFAPLKNKIISIRPLTVIDSPLSPISWSCGNAKPPQGMQAIGENKTNLKEVYLVTVCRSNF
ncbi:MAG: pilin [Methylococcales bacterium]|jgi:type IV pilus assembly protein PilA|nr:pilin [Methylococcales bacterium]MBT7408307.1 pilin [Methylococcales bacterium]